MVSGAVFESGMVRILATEGMVWLAGLKVKASVPRLQACSSHVDMRRLRARLISRHLFGRSNSTALAGAAKAADQPLTEGRRPARILQKTRHEAHLPRLFHHTCPRLHRRPGGVVHR